MDLPTQLTKIPSLSKLTTHLRIPLYRNGYALVLSSAVTSALGLLYWVVAARNYTTEAVGLNSAVLSVMVFLANLSTLNLNNALNRFIPTAGRAANRLVRSSYLISVGTALVASLIFISGLGLWAPTLGFLRSNYLFVLWFALATMVWCIFLLQDSVFTGLRQATWVPIENAVFAVAKIALLLVFAGRFVQYGVLASWTIPLSAVIIPVNILIFRRLIPAHVRAAGSQSEPIAPSEIARYVAGNYLGSLIWIATISLLPILVTERIGATANAYFYLSWTIAYSFYLVSRNMGMSLITEGAANQARLDILSYRTFMQTGRLLLPAVIFVTLLAPYLLKLFGESYAAEGVRLLRLLCLSALPYLVTSTYLSIARVKRRIAALIVVQSSLAALIFGMSIVLMDRFGITGIGIAWLVSQSVVATVLLFTGLSKAWLPYLNMQVPLRLLSVPRRALWRWRKRVYLRRASDLIPEIVDRISPINSTAPPSNWKALQILPTVSDMAVVTVGTEEHGVQALLKLPQTDSAVDSMHQQTAVLSRLHSDPRLQEWRRVLPSLLVVDESCEHPYTVERVMPGIEGRAMLTDPANRSRMQMAAALTIGELHRRTGVPVVVDRERLMRWIDKPLSSLRAMVAAYLHSDGTEEAVDRLETELRGALAGRSLSVGWVHGDFVPGNVLFTPDGASVTGIVDWDLASPEDIPQLDLTWFLIATRMAVEKRELGDVLRDLLERPEWRSDEQQLLETAHWRSTDDGLDSRSALLLCWLRHVAGTIYKSNRYATHRLWVAKNVVGVLRAI